MSYVKIVNSSALFAKHCELEVRDVEDKGACGKNLGDFLWGAG